MTEETKKIKFIYNSKSGLTSSLIDFFHKNISPKTYKCNNLEELIDLLKQSIGRKVKF